MPFLHDLLALKRPSRKWGPGGNWVGCKMACFGWNTHPSAQGSSTLTPLSPQDSPLDPFRGVSSCEGPGGQTWKNTCKARARLRVSPWPPARACNTRGSGTSPRSAAPKHSCWRRDLACLGYTGLLKVSVGNPGALQMGGNTAEFSTSICKIRLQTTSRCWVKWKGFSSLNMQQFL